MELKFRVAARIARPVHEVFEAVADPAQLSRYFTTGGAQGRLETGATVTWDFHDYPGAFPVQVIEVVPNERIVLEWAAGEGDPPNVGETGRDAWADAGYTTTVTMTFKSLEDGRTLVEIAEEGWRETQAALQGSYGNCQGWSQMLCALKIWLEHGINLRDGMYK
ncbi:MAG: ATPase [Sphingomonadales bacterium 32-68-7]|nr:MAG: ATPase [Sphingomonadales bacterium 12-68-11]OYX08128.1 MAG: ATPase [Sphingomonadales bacterium 32-68-7]